MKTIGERLAYAREKAGFVTPGDAAASLGTVYSTYIAHENGTGGFKVDKAVQYARKFKVSLDWLLTGKGKGPDGSKAWEIYLMMADLPDDDLDYVKNSVEYARKSSGRAA
jgi:hypothetical protein